MIIYQHLRLEFMKLVLESLQSEAYCPTDERVVLHLKNEDVFLAFVAINFLKDCCFSSFKPEI